MAATAPNIIEILFGWFTGLFPTAEFGLQAFITLIVLGITAITYMDETTSNKAVFGWMIIVGMIGSIFFVDIFRIMFGLILVFGFVALATKMIKGN